MNAIDYLPVTAMALETSFFIYITGKYAVATRSLRND